MRLYIGTRAHHDATCARVNLKWAPAARRARVLLGRAGRECGALLAANRLRSESCAADAASVPES